MKLFGTFIFCWLCLSAQAIDSTATLNVTLNADTVLMDTYFKATYTLANAGNASFEQPTFENFTVVGGPNQSSSYQMANGKVTQSLSYTYYLRPVAPGTYPLPTVSIELDDGSILESNWLEITVVENPEGLKRNPYTSQNKRIDEMRKRMEEMMDGFGQNLDESDFFNNDNFFQNPEDLLKEFENLLPNREERSGETPSEPTDKPKKKRKIYRI